MTDQKKTIEAAMPLDERSVARKYGLRELRYPDREEIKTMLSFLDGTIATGRCGPIPNTATLVLLEYLQGTLNRQHITKGPRMSQEEYDILQAPYYLGARILSKLSRAKQDETKGKLYQITYLSLNHFIDLLRSLLDPGCYWLRLKAVPSGVTEAMQALREFLAAYPEQRSKGRT
ncbi:MAG TPA: hypothetical protein VFN10_12120 [Thermoanaerobaculia bacterium]|nr:hypothetical protein [Thermoanaerobaculia bacterium]